MARVTSDGQTCASKTPPLMLQTSHLRDLRQTGCDVVSVLVSQEADVLLANLAYGHERKGTAFVKMIVPPRVCLHPVRMTLVGMVSGPLIKTLTLVVSSEAFPLCMTTKLGKKML